MLAGEGTKNFLKIDKKILKLAVFGVQVAAFLIENLTQITGILLKKAELADAQASGACAP